MSEEIMNGPDPAENTAEYGQAEYSAANGSAMTAVDHSGTVTENGNNGTAQKQEPVAPELPDSFGLDIAGLLADPQLSPGLRDDPQLENEFRALALELGIGQEQAQKLAGLYVRSLGRHISKFSAEHAELMHTTEARWIDELKADKDFSIQIGKARTAIKAYGGPELISVLEETRLGSHPAFVRFMAKVGAELAEPSFARAQAASSTDRSPADVLYPNQGR